MQLLGVNKIRLNKHPKGWLVESMQLCGFWPFKKWKWKYAISYSGMNSEPYYFSTKEAALRQAKNFFLWGVLSETNFEDLSNKERFLSIIDGVDFKTRDFISKRKSDRIYTEVWQKWCELDIAEFDKWLHTKITQDD